MGRARVQRFTELVDEWIEVAVFRVLESDGAPCVNWLPGLEIDDPEGPLDRGGFDTRPDAEAFALGVCWERAFAGLLPGVTTADIDRERRKLDVHGNTHRQLEAPEPPAKAPIVQHRRQATQTL